MSSLLADFVVELEEGELGCIIWVNDVSDAHELVVVHIQQVVLDASLVSHIRLRLDAFDVPGQTESIFVPDEVLGHKDQLGCVHDLLWHLSCLKWVSDEQIEALLAQLILEKTDQVVTEVVYSG